jgi:hypothetical protein
VGGGRFDVLGKRYFHVVRVPHRGYPRRDILAPQRSALISAEHARACSVNVVAVRNEKREAADALPYGGCVQHECQWRVEAPAQVGVEACSGAAVAVAVVEEHREEVLHVGGGWARWQRAASARTMFLSATATSAATVSGWIVRLPSRGVRSV